MLINSSLVISHISTEETGSRSRNWKRVANAKGGWGCSEARQGSQRGHRAPHPTTSSAIVTFGKRKLPFFLVVV